MSVTIKVQLPDDLIPLLDQRAKLAGVDREQYLRAMIASKLTAPGRLAQILGAFRRQVAESRLSSHELFHLFDAARNEAKTNTNRGTRE